MIADGVEDSISIRIFVIGSISGGFLLLSGYTKTFTPLWLFHYKNAMIVKRKT